MGKKQNIEGLIRHANEKKMHVRKRVITSIRALEKSGLSINFSCVARKASVSRNYLYSQPDLRQIIMDMRSNKSSCRRAVQNQRTTKSAAKIEEALRIRNETLKNQIRELKSELKATKKALEYNLGELAQVRADYIKLKTKYENR